MNLLLNPVPSSVEIDGVRYRVNADFRTFIRIEQILNDREMPNKEKVHSWLNLVYGAKTPQDIRAAISKIMWLYNCGAEPEERKGSGQKARQQLLYDFEFDAPYIYAAFLAQYGIDLNEADLHWWKFLALFKGLTKDNKIVEIMSYRAADLGEIKDEKEQARIARLKRIYAIPVMLTPEEKVAQAGAVFGGGLF